MAAGIGGAYSSHAIKSFIGLRPSPSPFQRQSEVRSVFLQKTTKVMSIFFCEFRFLLYSLLCNNLLPVFLLLSAPFWSAALFRRFLFQRSGKTLNRRAEASVLVQWTTHSANRPNGRNGGQMGLERIRLGHKQFRRQNGTFGQLASISRGPAFSADPHGPTI